MRALLALALWAALPLGASAARKEKLVSQDLQWKGQFCGVSVPGTRLAKTPAEWEALWKEIGRPAPAQDLKGQMAVAVFLGERPTGGFRVQFLEPKTAKERVTVGYRVLPPKGMAIQAFTQPYAVRLLPLPKLPVELIEEK